MNDEQWQAFFAAVREACTCPRVGPSAPTVGFYRRPAIVIGHQPRCPALEIIWSRDKRPTTSEVEKVSEENVCEHCYQLAPAGKRFCSDSCRRCELAECDETQECARLCLPRWVLRPGAHGPTESAPSPVATIMKKGNIDQ